MPALCTVTNYKYLPNAVFLADSFYQHKYGDIIYLYYFDTPKSIIQAYNEKYPRINFISIPKSYSHSYDPFVFWYKTYAINDCLKNTDYLVYSDATNLFLKYYDIISLFQDDMLTLPYNHHNLANKYWTTKKCLEKLSATKSESEQVQYYAGFQCYKNTEKNIDFVKHMHELMCDPDIAAPGANIPHPDGNNAPCLYHRNDQSVLSILLHKLDRNQSFDPFKQALFGDHQTYKLFDNSYTINNDLMCLSPRHTKHMSLGYAN